MERIARSCYSVVILFLSVAFSMAVDSPSPAPQLNATGNTNSPVASPPEVPSPANPPSIPPPSPSPGSDSPPAPPSHGAASSPSPSDSPAPSPAPAPEDASDIRHETSGVNGKGSEEPSSGGLSGGKKAGIAVGVITGAVLVGLGSVVYKKRQQNIQRSQYGYAARRELL